MVVAGTGWILGFIIRRPQTSLAAARPSLRASTGAVSQEKRLSRKHTDAPLTGPLLELVNGLSLDHVLLKWYPSENSPQGAWDHVAEEMLLLFAESGHPIFRSTTSLSRGQLKSKGKGKGKVSIQFTADQDTVDTIYRIILSVNQLSGYGAVFICEEFEDHQDFLEKSKPKYLLMMKIPETTKSFGSNTFNKLNHFHQKTN